MLAVTPNNRLWQRRSPRLFGCCLAVTFSVIPSSVQAGSVTSESIWNEENALQNAKQQVPSERTITGQKCRTIQVRDSDRYRCTITYE